MRPSLPISPFRRGLTLVELMIVITIVALLALGAFSGYGYFVKRAESAACIKKIANFGKALQACLTDEGRWPQEEVLWQNGAKPDDDVLWDWWFTKLKKCGLSENDWYCPSDMARKKEEAKADANDKSKDSSSFTPAIKDPSYQPAKFGPDPYAPFADAYQPWAWETTGHPDGLNKVMPNGTVQKEFNFKALDRSRLSGGGK